MSESFRIQCQIRPDVKNVVGHISLDFSIEDSDRLTDEMMGCIAQEYMHKMGIVNTQYLIARHHDRKHPHCHILFNRVNNDGVVISDKNDRHRSTVVCKELTILHNLHMAKGKDHVNRDRLKGTDAIKYAMYDALCTVVRRSKDWDELRGYLKRYGMDVEFVNNGSTSKVQGVTFVMNGIRINGSKIDRRFSFSKIDNDLRQNQLRFHERQSGGAMGGISETDLSIRTITVNDAAFNLGSDTSRLPEVANELHAAEDPVSDAMTDIMETGGAVVSAAVQLVTVATTVKPSSGGGGDSKPDDLSDKDNKYKRRRR